MLYSVATFGECCLSLCVYDCVGWPQAEGAWVAIVQLTLVLTVVWIVLYYVPLLTQTNYGLARTWLLQMGQGASDNNLTIQYCMPWPRHYLQSLEVSTVTQTRISDDYHPGNTQWNIGDTVIFAEAMGLAAFKDVSGTLLVIH